MGNQEVNKHTLIMEHSEQVEVADQTKVKKADILRNFQISFFAMSPLAAFPWSVSVKSCMKWKLNYIQKYVCSCC